MKTEKSGALEALRAFYQRVLGYSRMQRAYLRLVLPAFERLQTQGLAGVAKHDRQFQEMTAEELAAVARWWPVPWTQRAVCLSPIETCRGAASCFPSRETWAIYCEIVRRIEGAQKAARERGRRRKPNQDDVRNWVSAASGSSEVAA